MLLSILIPSYNHGRYIEQTLDSCLSQAYSPVELIVADGGSEDDTVAILQRYSARHPQVRWSSAPDKGPADAVNKALAMANGEICGIQSSDDFYCAGAFDAVMPLFKQHPDCGLVIGDYCGIDSIGKVLYEEHAPDASLGTCFARSFALPQSSIFFRTALGRAVGGWNAAYFAPDQAFWLRIRLQTRARHVPRVLSAWRIYEGQRTHSPEGKARALSDYRRMLRDASELKRASWNVRRLARASEHLNALRFNPASQRAAGFRHLMLGFLLHPTFWRAYPWPIASWLPGAGIFTRFRQRWLSRAAP